VPVSAQNRPENRTNPHTVAVELMRGLLFPPVFYIYFPGIFPGVFPGIEKI
jgi:hypothetical protein